MFILVSISNTDIIQKLMYVRLFFVIVFSPESGERNRWLDVKDPRACLHLISSNNEQVFEGGGVQVTEWFLASFNLAIRSVCVPESHMFTGCSKYWLRLCYIFPEFLLYHISILPYKKNKTIFFWALFYLSVYLSIYLLYLDL